MADHVSCGILMKQIGDEMQKRADNKMRSWDMTMAQAGALLALNDAPEKQLSMKQLEKVLCIAQSTTAGIIPGWSRKGWWKDMLMQRINGLSWCASRRRE